ncbi:MAG TPA: glycosyltransferase family 4 protein, partial [Thermoanaerobaculia bacterium]|nr:glycosyltransferase family 4 protein [Thermoanaerobaculia bacterium]
RSGGARRRRSARGCGYHDAVRILVVANVAEDPNIGAAGTEYQTVAALRALGHDVDAVWADGVGRTIRHGNLNLLLELPRRYERVVAERLARAPYDVIHMNQPHGYRAARLVQRRWPRTAFFHRSHGFEPRVEEVLASRRGPDERSALRRAASSLIAPLVARHYRAIVRWADGHLVSSSDDRDYMIERYGVAPERVAAIPQAAPDEYLATPAPPMTEARLRRVLYAGQFAFVKAPMIVAEAMNRIGNEATFTWVCAREHHDRVRALLAPGLRVELRDWMPQSELRALYDASGIFLFPSFYEGFGKAPLEAMSRGACVVASRIGGMRDVIESDSGVLVEPGDAAATADAALALLRDLPRATAMSAAAARRARQYSWSRTAAEIAAFYRARVEAKR